MLTNEHIDQWVLAHGMEHHYEIINQLKLAIKLQSELDAANAKLERIRSLCDLSEGNVTSLRYVLNLIVAILDGGEEE